VAEQVVLEAVHLFLLLRLVLEYLDTMLAVEQVVEYSLPQQ
jgi:hypothetical protein